jgi:hypothetical protein
LSYIDENLSSGEAVLYQTRLHWIAMLTHFLVAAVVGLLGIALLVTAGSEIKDKGSIHLDWLRSELRCFLLRQ